MTRSWKDRDGVEWSIQWSASRQAAARVNGGPDTLPAGLHFTCNAVVFFVALPYEVDPRAVPTSVLQRMVDKALG